jgi:FtsP/CotA-like multicopper oxidase with cupredoxin domain
VTRLRRPERSGFPGERGCKDTVPWGDFESADVLVRFGRPGLYLIQCHQPAHEGQGMMSNFEVA